MRPLREVHRKATNNASTTRNLSKQRFVSSGLQKWISTEIQTGRRYFRSRGWNMQPLMYVRSVASYTASSAAQQTPKGMNRIRNYPNLRDWMLAAHVRRHQSKQQHSSNTRTDSKIHTAMEAPPKPQRPPPVQTTCSVSFDLRYSLLVLSSSDLLQCTLWMWWVMGHYAFFSARQSKPVPSFALAAIPPPSHLPIQTRYPRKITPCWQRQSRARDGDSCSLLF